MNMANIKNISFIGMAGCGKSTIGKKLADELATSFIDTDILIERKYQSSLEEIKQKFGYKFVRSAEEEVILNLDINTKIISTGGSAVYSLKSMKHLKTFSKIVYINTPLEIVIERINTGQERGLAVPEGLTISEVFAEREPLYAKFSDFILDGSKNLDEKISIIKSSFLDE